MLQGFDSLAFLFESESRLAKGIRLQNVLLQVQILSDSPKLGASREVMESWQSGLLHFFAKEEDDCLEGSTPSDSSNLER
jgi:hypothetical protein